MIASLQCIIWAVFIIVLPSRAAMAYGLAKPPEDLFLWQGIGLVILLFGLGYGLAATNPRQHWGIVLIGLIAKVLGPIGMVWAVSQGDAPTGVLWLLPINDCLWWIPFAIIIRSSRRDALTVSPADKS